MYLAKNIFSASMVLLLVALVSCSKNPGSPEGDLPELVDPFAQNERLGRGINLGNALEAPNEGDWGVVLKSEYFDLIRQAGFQSVRIPIRWSAHTTANPPYAIDSRFMSRVDWAINQALSRDLLVMINIHHYEEIMQDASSQKARFLAIWQKLATHYQDYPSGLLFEILNEPNNSLSPQLWNEFLADAIAVIRDSNPNRTLVVGTANWGGIPGVRDLVLPEDNNLIVTVHYYNPFFFTHQGAEWVDGSNAWLGTTWSGTPAEQQVVMQDFFEAIAWASNNQVPLNLGEFGAYSKADMDSRAKWTSFVARQAESSGMSWHYWEFISGFGAYDGSANNWNEPLLRALIPETAKHSVAKN